MAVLEAYLASIDAAADEDEADDLLSDGIDVMVDGQWWLLGLDLEGWEAQPAHVSDQPYGSVLEVDDDDDGELRVLCGPDVSAADVIGLLLDAARRRWH